MRIIDRRWTELAAGLQAVQSLQGRLTSEFSHAVEVGYQQQYNRDMDSWRKKRRVFFAFVVIAPLSILALCLAAYYFREVSCVIIYWIVLVLIILGTLGIAARNYITGVMGQPKLGTAAPPYFDLEASWWAALAPQELANPSGRGGPGTAFLALLADLPDTFVARRGPPVEGEASLYVFAPSGPWLFTLRDWCGDIVRQDELWKDVPKKGEPIMYTQPPDLQWVRLKEVLVSLLNERFPQLSGRIQGGVVFTDPKVHLYKDQIKGNTAAYGLASAWAARLQQAPPADGLGLEMQLEILDALIAREIPAGQALDLSNSAKELAARMYRQAVADLRSFVARMVGERVDLQSSSR